jgi:hypothetical protein
MNSEELQKIYIESFKNISDNMMHIRFLDRLKESSLRFQNILENEILEKLQETAKKSRKKCKFKSKLNFNEKLGNVKISTLVKGWKTETGWDTFRYQELGLLGTPFEDLAEKLKQRGINVHNISDSSKGFGFWIEASF